MKPIKLPFGLNENNKLVHIADVERGKKCNCICPGCGSSLIASKGSKNQPHFKHAVVIECKGGFESAVHLAAKKMIMERGQITLPEHIFSVSATDSRGIKHTEHKTIVEGGKVVKFESVQEEIEFHGMKVDILAKAKDKPLVIEIFYRHKVDDQKRIKIVEANISAIEINLSDLVLEDVKDWESFWLYINNSQRVQWLHNAKACPVNYPELEKQLAIKIQKLEWVYKQNKIQAEKQAEKEISRALYNLKTPPSKEYITYLKQKAETSRKRDYYISGLPFLWHELPEFVNADIPSGDWIFGCDRRFWQTTIYKYFIWTGEESFSIKRVYKFLEHYFKIHPSVKTIESYSTWFPHLISADIWTNLPSSWKTLRAYFNYLEDLGMLKFSGGDYYSEGNDWFRVISKKPRAQSGIKDIS